MKAIISLKMHGVLDYAGGLLITFSPWLFGFAEFGGAALFLPVCLGSMQLVMVVFSNHPLGLFKVFPMQLHLIIDMIVGVILIAAPLFFGFYQFVFFPHMLLGMISLFCGVTHQAFPSLQTRII
jgi:hypothetical protein